MSNGMNTEFYNNTLSLINGHRPQRIILYCGGYLLLKVKTFKNYSQYVSHIEGI